MLKGMLSRMQLASHILNEKRDDISLEYDSSNLEEGGGVWRPNRIEVLHSRLPEDQG